ncbi:MAG: diguanylate cyclase, partial [Sphaerochaeta sp.]
MHQKEGNPITSNNFEQIQLLNNELVNAQRKLQKANIQLKHLNEELNNRLVKDPLTSLVRCYQYRSEIDRTISLQPKMLGLFAFIDIDDFKHINDTLGHAAGDQYLMEFARRLQSLDFGMATICMRIAGDEFGLYLHG